MDRTIHFGPLVRAGTLLGAGMGGFIDGIVFHQILQLHNMMSAKIPVDDLNSAKENMVWDGYFHAGVFAITVLGLVTLFRAGARRDVPWSGRVLAGAWVFGWGLFNVIEGTVNHLILNTHHLLEYTAPNEQRMAEFVFLGASVLLMLIGWGLIRSGKAAWQHGANRSPGAGSISTDSQT